MSIYFPEITIDRPPQLGSGQWRLTNLTDITVLFGKNGSGKSLLLRAWRDQKPDSMHYILPERTGDMTFEPGMIQQQLTGLGRQGQSRTNFILNYRQQVIARINTYFATRGDQRGPDFLGDPDELERLLGVLVPDFRITLAPRDNPPYRLIRSATNERIANVGELSSGEAQLVTLGLDILTIAATWDMDNNDQRLLLIDEPDAHIHPDLQVRFADFLEQVVVRFGVQAVVATHSTTLLSALGQFGGTHASAIYLRRLQDTLVAERFDNVRKRISACLGGHVLMGPIFGARLLLVEGDDDYRIWSQVPRHHIVSFAVIPCNGDEIRKYQKSLELILASLTDATDGPLGFALIDGDKPLPRHNTQNPQTHVRFVRLACRETENLYLTTEVLADMETTWEEAVTKIEAGARHFGNKAPLLSQASSWDRRTVDLKDIIGEIAGILDKKNIHWTSRVGQRLGRERPTGELAGFLGSTVLSALWRDVIASAPASPENGE